MGNVIGETTFHKYLPAIVLLLVTCFRHIQYICLMYCAYLFGSDMYILALLGFETIQVFSY